MEKRQLSWPLSVGGRQSCNCNLKTQGFFGGTSWKATRLPLQSENLRFFVALPAAGSVGKWQGYSYNLRTLRVLTIACAYSKTSITLLPVFKQHLHHPLFLVFPISGPGHTRKDPCLRTTCISLYFIPTDFSSGLSISDWHCSFCLSSPLLHVFVFVCCTLA